MHTQRLGSCILTYETCYCEIVLDLFHFFEFLEVKHLFFTLLSELAREVCYARNYRIISPLGLEKFLLDARQTAKIF